MYYIRKATENNLCMCVLFASFHDDDFVTWLPTEFRRLAQQGRNVRGVNCTIYIYLFSRMLGCHGNPEKPVGDGSFLRFR